MILIILYAGILLLKIAAIMGFYRATETIHLPMQMRELKTMKKLLSMLMVQGLLLLAMLHGKLANTVL